MKRKLKLWIRSAFSLIHIIAVKICNIRGFTASAIQDLSLTTRISLEKGGQIKLGKGIHARRNVVIEAMSGGKIEIGDGCFFNNGCMIVGKEKITIGEKTSFGPNVFIYDHDHDTNRSPDTENTYKSSPVEIGKRVWIGANTVILRGTRIGDNCVVGAGSVISGEYEPNTVIIQKRSTELKKVCTGTEIGKEGLYGRTAQRTGFKTLV
jgi:acetyltransferase-like isoleucine patch superfamily enzyme